MRRTDRRPPARPRSMASAKAGCFFRRSIVRVLTLKKEATSASVHCSPHSFSSSTRLMFTALRPAPGRAPPVMLLLSFVDISLGFPLLPAPRRDSYSRPLALRGDLVEGAAIALEGGLLVRERLPPLHHNVHEFRVKFHPEADTFGDFGCRKRGAAAEERVIDQFAAFQVVQYRAPHQFDRLLGGMVVLRFVGATHDEFWRRRSPDRGVLAGFSEPLCVLLSDVPTRFVLVPVVSPCQNGAALIPDDLLRIEKTDAQKAVQHLPREDRGVPHVGDLKARHQLEGRSEEHTS